MRVDLDAKIRTSDGHDAGSVQRAVVDPPTNEIRELVVSTGGLLGRDVLVPRHELEAATPDGDTLRLRLSKAELERMPDYVPANYVPPPTGWTFPAAYAFGAYGGFIWPVEFQHWQLPSVPADDDSIGKAAVVLDRDGEDLGVVDDVRFDPASGRLQGFVLRVGGVLTTLLGGGETVEVGGDLVERVEGGVVRLRVDKEHFGLGL
jgi:sporulation protein YlmC with PRC-barrel domain